MSTKLNKNQLLACELLAFGHSAKETSKLLNIRSETISRWKKNIRFQNKIDDFHIVLIKQLIDKQLSLLHHSQNAILDIFISDKIAPEFKANTGIKFLNLYGGTFSFSDRLNNYYNSKITNEKESNRVFKRILNIIEAIMKIERFGDKLSDEEYRLKVKHILHLSNIDENEK